MSRGGKGGEQYELFWLLMSEGVATATSFSLSPCAPIVWGFQWRLRITCGFAGLWKRRTWPVSSSDCVRISGEVEDCMRICRIVWREVGVVGGGRRAVGLAFLEDEQTENIFLRIENFVDCLSLR